MIQVYSTNLQVNSLKLAIWKSLIPKAETKMASGHTKNLYIFIVLSMDMLNKCIWNTRVCLSHGLQCVHMFLYYKDLNISQCSNLVSASVFWRVIVCTVRYMYMFSTVHEMGFIGIWFVTRRAWPGIVKDEMAFCWDLRSTVGPRVGEWHLSGKIKVCLWVCPPIF